MIGAKCDLRDRFAKKFLTLEDEYIIFSTRQHWSVLLPAFIINTSLALIVAVVVSFSSMVLPIYFFSFLLIALIVLTISMEILIKQLVEWFFHFYIVTNRKIVEVAYRPMFSRVLYEVLLDQVKCTEVDVKGNGFSGEVFNVGAVLITFDRPTSEKIFTIEKIKNPNQVAMHLADSFEMKFKKENRASWINNPLVNSSLSS